MFKRLEIKKFFASLLVTCMLAGGIAALPATVYAVPEDPATTESVVEGEDANAEAGIATLEEPVVSPSQQATGITIDAADEEEEEDVNPMDTILGFDTIIKNVWSKICSRLLIILSILVAIVIGILIYIMATQTSKLSKQNQVMSRRPNRALASEQPAAQGEESVRQVKQFGDTLRIRRTVQQGAPAQQTNMQRPVAPQRPSRPAQGQMMQPGVRRPVQAQPGHAIRVEQCDRGTDGVLPAQHFRQFTAERIRDVSGKGALAFRLRKAAQRQTVDCGFCLGHRAPSFFFRSIFYHIPQ